MRITRRQILYGAAVASSVGVARACVATNDDAGANEHTAARDWWLDSALLGALADAVLPSEVGTEGVLEAVHDLNAFLAAYSPGAELEHGYLSHEIRVAHPNPGPIWHAQLRDLDRRAIETSSHPFARLARNERTALVESAVASFIDDAPGSLTSVGAAARAPHVAIALLARFYSSAAAWDLCFGAGIGRLTCRGLETGTGPPAGAAAGSRV